MSRTVFSVFLAIFVFVKLFQMSGAVENIEPEKKQKIDEFINGLLNDCKKLNIVGINLAVVYRGETLYTTGYGLRDLGRYNSIETFHSQF